MENIIIQNKTRDMLLSISSTILHVRCSEHANSKSVQSSPIWRYLQWIKYRCYILLLSLSSIKTPLTHILNLSLSEGVFPEELKKANVIPLFKADDPMLFNIYRPVSLLCVLSKVFEKIMNSRLMSFLEFHKILYHKQFGFRKKFPLIWPSWFY